MSGGSFESSQRTEPVCASRFSSIKNCFKTRASGLARGRGWSRIGHSEPTRRGHEKPAPRGASQQQE